MTGWNAGQAGKKQQNQAAETLGSAGQTAGNIAAINPAQYAQQAGQAGTALGDTMGRTAATAQTQQGMQAARTAGVNKGQAALLGAQGAGQAYTQGQQAGQGLGMSVYGQGAQNQLGAVNTQANIGGQQAGAGQARSQQGAAAGKDFMSGVTGLATAALSDENAKRDIKDVFELDKAADHIIPKSFKYKEGDGKREVGVIAQDVEKVAPQNIIETPEGKAVDTRKQTMSNTAWLMEAAKRIAALEGKK